MNSNNSFKNSIFWQQLLAKKQSIIKTPIAKLSAQNQNKKFSVNINNLDLVIDFSKQHIDAEIIKILCDAAVSCELDHKIKDLFKGEKLNTTQDQRVWHTELRNPNPFGDIAVVLQKMADFIENLYSNNDGDNNCQNIICLGIGGSYLGPQMVCKALDAYTHESAKNLKFHFIANADPETIDRLLITLNPKNTIAIISSKSFTTTETLSNAKVILNWLQNPTKIFASTCNIQKAVEFGVKLENVFPFWNFVGGRYSVWSSVGLPIAIKIGMENFKKFLFGGYSLDQHFLDNQFSANIPVLMALIGIWNINFMQYNSLAIMPYLDALEDLPAYLQQLDTESNGKTVDLNNNYIDYDTAPIIWGGVGCNGQHSYMQMLHQGSQIVPVDFLVATQKSKLLLANCLAQSQALMVGTNYQNNNHTNNKNNNLENFKACSGNRPSSTIFFPTLTPEIMGALIALYEHKVFVQGVMWNINSFDQWGVELGKTLADQYLLQIK